MFPVEPAMYQSLYDALLCVICKGISMLSRCSLGLATFDIENNKSHDGSSSRR